MRRFHIFCLLGGLILALTSSVFGAEYRLTNGDIVRGQLASSNEEGVVIRLDIGGFSSRISWTKLTQESLKEISKNAEAAKFAEAFIDEPPEARAEAQKKKEIILKPVPRVEQPAKGGIFASATTPIGLALLGVFLLANIYAGYEIARYRNRPAGVICVVSAILPVVGPLLFLSMPTLQETSSTDEGAASAPPPIPEAPSADAKKTGQTARSGLSVAGGHEKKAEGGVDQTVYRRGDVTFNRRFVETKFAGFFRIVPSEAEKDFVLVIKLAKGEHVAKRVSRISMTEMHIQPAAGGGEIPIPFGEIVEMRVRHKDAK